MARLNAHSGWERLLVPPFVFFFHLLYPFASVADRSSRVAAAAGGCVLVRRRALEKAGGLAAISDALIDDVALARVLKDSGARLWLGFDSGIVSLRRYGFHDLWTMVSRSAFVQLRRRWDLLALTVLGVLLFFVSPPLLLVAGGALAATGYAAGWLVAAAAAAAWVLATRALLPYVRHHHVPAAWAAALPLASLFYALMTLGSAWNHLRGRTATWRGRRYT